MMIYIDIANNNEHSQSTIWYNMCYSRWKSSSN